MLTSTEADAFNRAAVLLPQTDDGTLPCVQVAGVQVYAYVDASGVVRVAVHLDTTDSTLLDVAGLVPLVITVADTVVYDSEPESSQNPLLGDRPGQAAARRPSRTSFWHRVASYLRTDPMLTVTVRVALPGQDGVPWICDTGSGTGEVLAVRLDQLADRVEARSDEADGLLLCEHAIEIRGAAHNILLEQLDGALRPAALTLVLRGLATRLRAS